MHNGPEVQRTRIRFQLRTQRFRASLPEEHPSPMRTLSCPFLGMSSDACNSLKTQNKLSWLSDLGQYNDIATDIFE